MKINIDIDIPNEAVSLFAAEIAKHMSLPVAAPSCCEKQPEPEPEKPKAKKAPAKKAPAKPKKMTKKVEEGLRERLEVLAMQFVNLTSQPETLELIRKHLGQRLSTDYAAPEDDVREIGRDQDQKLTRLPQLAKEDLEGVIALLETSLAEKGIRESA